MSYNLKWEHHPPARDKAAIRNMRGSQEEVKELAGTTRTRESYLSCSISYDPVGDRVAGWEERRHDARWWGYRSLEALELAEAHGDPDDLDYRLAMVLLNAFRSDRDFARLGLGWAEDIAEIIEERHPGLLESGFAKIREEGERLAAKSKAKSEKASQASKEKRAARKKAA